MHTFNIIKSVRPDAKIAVGRELTKIFEEVLVDNISNIIEHFVNNQPKGEFVVMVFRKDNLSDENEMQNQVKMLKDKGFSPKDISVILSELCGYNKNSVYKISIGK
jgi:16S rRNA (cytidine1402-2'-O)-methyltransferase